MNRSSKTTRKAKRVVSTPVRAKRGNQRLRALELWNEHLETEIEQLRQTQLELELSRDRFAALYDAMPVGYVSFNHATFIQDMNLTAARMFNIDRAIALAMPFTNLVVKEDLPIFRDHLRAAQTSRRVMLTDLHLRVRPNSQFVGQIVTQVASDTPSNRALFQCAITDIANRGNVEHERLLLLEQVKDGRDRLERLSRALLRIQEDERRRLARELHDSVSQNLTALNVNLHLIETQMTGKVDERVCDQLRAAQRFLTEIMGRIRVVTTDLRPTALDFYGLATALKTFVDSFAGRTNLLTELKIDPALPRLTPEIEIELFRITQEALTNVLKHARATHVVVSLSVAGRHIRLTIADNGVGFKPELLDHHLTQRGLGLITMSERAAAIGGTYQIYSRPGEGTQVVIEVMR